MRNYAIGLDIGIASVGWAVVCLDANEKPCGIIRMGSRIFDRAEQPKTGESLAAPRREARSARRRLRRHRHRNQRIRYLLVTREVITQQQLESLFSGKLEDIYQLRAEALDRKITAQEFARLLLHLAQRRGFRSNRKNPSDGDDGAILSAVSENARRMQECGYRTPGEMLYKDPLFEQHKRNKGGNYLATVSRQMVEEEVRLIFAAQRKLGQTAASEELEEAYLEILLGQRSFDDGPGGDSPYGGNQIEKMVGRCTFHPELPRAAKATYSFEYFSLLEKINHIRIQLHGKSLSLTREQRETLISLAHDTEDLNFARIRKELSLSPDARFNLVHYPDGNVAAAEKKAKLGCMKAYHQMRRAFDKIKKGYITGVSIGHRNAIGTALTLYKTSANIAAYLQKAGVDPVLIDAAENIHNFSKFGHLSVKACDAIIPHLEAGMNYSDACTAAGYQFKGHDSTEKTLLLPPVPDDNPEITSPVVRRAISQTIKVINAIIRSQGCSPLFINVELAREMAKNFDDRKKMERDMLANQAANERIMERLRTEFGIASPSGQDLVKLKLYEQQGGICPYSLKPLSLPRIFEPDYAEVDHIIPYSISFDDSYKNKVLVFAAENRNKGNRLPLQYLQGKQREDFIVWVRNSVKDPRKQRNLLKEAFTKEDEEKFKERNLQDTKTASRFILNYIQDHLLFAPSQTGKKKRVTAVNGAVTDQMRKRWGIHKVRANGDVHHAVDALVVVCTTDALIQQVSRYNAHRECRYTHAPDRVYAVDETTGEIIKGFPYPWPHFRKELEGHLSSNPERVLMDHRLPLYVSGELKAPHMPIFVSRMPMRKVTGAAHKDTVKSLRTQDGKTVAVVKRPLTELRLKNGEIENYYAPESDRLLYEALVARLQQFGGDAKKAFAGDFHKPKADGTPGPVVKKVKLWEPTTLNVSVHGGNGIADNDSMVRVDVFYVEDDGYYLVPIYVADTLKETLPNRACVAYKPYEQWKIMRDEDFIFSLYPNDLIRVTNKRLIVLNKSRKESDLPDTIEGYSMLVYYKGMNISTGAITCISHDNAYVQGGIGVKTLSCIEKFTVDILGEYHKVGKETRQPFRMKRG